MTLKDELIRKIGQGKTVDELAKIFDMRKQTIRAMIETLLSRGKLKEVDNHGKCKSCPMSDFCPVTTSGQEKLYMVNEGRETDEEPNRHD